VDAIEGFFESTTPNANPNQIPLPGSSIVRLRKDRLIIDLREQHHFAQKHVPGAINIPLSSLSSETPSPFDDSKLLASQWTELDEILRPNSQLVRSFIPGLFNQKEVLVLCYDGDTSRMAVSILQGRNVAARCCRGGTRRLEQFLKADSPLQVPNPGFDLSKDFFGIALDRLVGTPSA
jgi:rhodanese-related sulfurtransferase